jgi:UDP-2-acetamido-3-amino-2,3-dideoxy-glucuronate N-acetyltransferase
MFVHETATIETGVEIGIGTKIWHHSHVMAGAILGEGVMLGHSVFVGAGVVIGSRSRIQNFANLPEGVELGECVFVGPHVSFTNVIYPRVEHPALGKYLQTSVGRGASIGAHATILCGLTLGDYCMVGAGAVVTREVPAFALVVGNPARQIGWVGQAGQKLRAEHSLLVCPLTQARYHVVQDQLEKVE